MTIEDVERVKRAVIRKYPISAGLALKGIKIELSNDVETAAVIGERNENGKLEVKQMKINPDFFERLTFSERVFLLAHEACHISLKHFSRALEKPKKDIERKYQEYCQKETDEQKRARMKVILHQRYNNIWNIATDACINAFLKKDGLTFPENVIDPKTGKKMQFIDIEAGMYKSAEKIYDHLVKKEEEKEQTSEPREESSKNNQGQNSQQGNSSTGNLDDVDIDNYKGIDSHEEWTDKKNQHQTEKQSEEEIDEETIFKKEEEYRKQKEEPNLKESLSRARGGNGLSDFVPAKPVVSWKRLLVASLEKTEEVWGTRRASRFNPNARIEERTYETLPSVEVILDTSGSISTDLLKGFLLQLCTLFESLYGEEVKIKVGCFANQFSGFTEIKRKEDILKYNPSVTGGTNFEVAATSFSKDPGRKITKIVFTDGVLGIEQKTRITDIIWIVFGEHMNFTPLGGRIIKVSQDEYNKMISTGKEQRLLTESLTQNKSKTR